jgi:toxin ParE1/3/4
MPREIKPLPQAEADLFEAYWWYESRDQGLGDEFLRCVETCYSRIAANPESYPVRAKMFRRALVRRFPYAIFFKHTTTDIVIYAVFNCHQKPSKLKEKLRSS